MQRGGDSFHVNDPLDAVTVLSSPLESEDSAPVIEDEHYAVSEI
jgi:hypothetical protein